MCEVKWGIHRALLNLYVNYTISVHIVDYVIESNVSFQ